MSKTANVASREVARQHALAVTLDGSPAQAEPRTFSTGSQGWNINTKVILLIEGKPVEAMFQGNVIINNSKSLPMDTVAEEQVAKSAAKKAGNG